VADAVQRAADRDAAFRASVAAKAATFGSVAAPIPEATTAIHACLRLLADLDPDKATERNGDGFGKGDSTHGAWLALQSSLSEADAITGRELCRRYRGQLGDRDADLLAMALGEVITARRVSKPRPVMTEPVSEPAATMPAVRTPEASPENLPLAWVEPKAALPIAALPISDTLGFLASPDVTNEDAPGANGPEQAADVIPHAHEPVRRGPGRPAKARQRQAALTQVERNRRYRETHTLIAMQVPLALVDRMRSARDARGLTTEQVLALAMNAVEAAECDETLTT
jgi:hypothetical protein